VFLFFRVFGSIQRTGGHGESYGSVKQIRDPLKSEAISIECIPNQPCKQETTK